MWNLHRKYLYATITMQTTTFLSSNDNLCEGGRGGEERRCSVETSNDIIEKYVFDVILYIKLVELKIMIYYCFNVKIVLLQYNIY